MKYLFANIFILLLISGMSSCKKDNKSFEEKLLSTTELIEVGSKTGTYQFGVLSNQNMLLETDVDWITLDTTELAKGKRQVSFQVADNKEDERSGLITVKVNENLS